MSSNELFFVIFPEDGVWVAHGLQHNIATYGGTLREVRKNISVLIKAYQMNGGFESVPKAGAELWEKFAYAIRAGKHLDEYLDAPVDQDASYVLELAAA